VVERCSPDPSRQANRTVSGRGDLFRRLSIALPVMLELVCRRDVGICAYRDTDLRKAEYIHDDP
jgi:hypothetical protein